MNDSKQIQLVSYAHQNDPNGSRFNGTSDSIPVWAVNVEIDDGIPKNWVGLPVHPTDQYVHWNDDNQVKKMNALRNAYELIVNAGFSQEIKLLLDSSYATGAMDESDNNNPDI